MHTVHKKVIYIQKHFPSISDSHSYWFNPKLNMQHNGTILSIRTVTQKGHWVMQVQWLFLSWDLLFTMASSWFMFLGDICSFGYTKAVAWYHPPTMIHMSLASSRNQLNLCTFHSRCRKLLKWRAGKYNICPGPLLIMNVSPDI